MEGEGKIMDAIISDSQKSNEWGNKIGKMGEEDAAVEMFSFFHFYKLDQYYVIAIPNKF
jgi:hypothetical protein